MNNIFMILANQSGGGLGMIIAMVAFIAIFYFIAVRPQKKQQKQIDDMRNNLQVGDEITTIGGIIGKIVSIKDETCVIETGRDGCKMRILKSAVRCVDVTANGTNYTIDGEEKPADDDAEQYDMPENNEENGKKGKKKKK